MHVVTTEHSEAARSPTVPHRPCNESDAEQLTENECPERTLLQKLAAKQEPKRLARALGSCRRICN